MNFVDPSGKIIPVILIFMAIGFGAGMIGGELYYLSQILAGNLYASFPLAIMYPLLGGLIGSILGPPFMLFLLPSLPAIGAFLSPLLSNPVILAGAAGAVGGYITSGNFGGAIIGALAAMALGVLIPLPTYGGDPG